jgi:hypothetical protein
VKTFYGGVARDLISIILCTPVLDSFHVHYIILYTVCSWHYYYCYYCSAVTRTHSFMYSYELQWCIPNLSFDLPKTVFSISILYALPCSKTNHDWSLAVQCQSMYRNEREHIENRISAPSSRPRLCRISLANSSTSKNRPGHPYDRIIYVYVRTRDLGPGKRSQKNNSIITGNTRVLYSRCMYLPYT